MAPPDAYGTTERRMRYAKYQRVIDVLGVLGVLSAGAYYYFGHLAEARWQSKDEELYSLWGNASTDLIGLWIGVRIIDFVIRRNEKEHSSRIEIVRNSRFLMSQTKRVVEFSSVYELDLLKDEINYTLRIVKKREKHLREDELSDLHAFYDELKQLLPDLDVLVKNEATSPDDAKQLRMHLKNRLASLAGVRGRAEQNVLEETDED
jgi:hypothetical protein